VLPERPPFTAIWRAIAAIPTGAWASYGEVARRAGLPRGARLVGFALRRAPPALELPWHRVVGAGGRIVFPKGSRAGAEQARRLAREGLRVEAGRIRGTARATAQRSLDELLWRRDGD
jgi:methylated-DNA-protein-cysteine methyltransferase related protein